MADTTAPMLLPLQGMNFAKGLFESFSIFAEYVVKRDKEQEADDKKQEEEWKKWRKENKDLFEALNKSQTIPPAIKTMQNKLLKTYFKVFVSGQLFKKIGIFLRDLWKKVSTAGTNLFFKILKFLLIMSIIDPNGTLFKSLLNIAINLLTWLLQMIAEWLPTLVTRMINLVTNVIPKILKEVMPKLLNAFSQMFFTLAKNFRKTNPALADLFETLGNLLKSPILLKALNDLINLFPVFVAILGVIAAITKLMPIIKFLWPILTKLFGFLTGTVGSALALVVGYLIAVWVFAEDIVKFMEGAASAFVGWVKKHWKIILGALAILLVPVTAIVSILVFAYGWIVALTYGLAKLFSFIKKHGFTKAMKKIGKYIWDWVVNMGKRIGSFFIWLWGTIISPFKAIFDFGKGVFSKGKKIGSIVLTFIKDTIWKGFILKWAITIKNKILSIFYNVKDFIFRFIIVGKNFLKYFPLLILESVKAAMPLMKGDPKKVEKLMGRAIAAETQVYLAKEHEGGDKARKRALEKEADKIQKETTVRSKIPAPSERYKKNRPINKRPRSASAGRAKGN
jgi:hypothetical protein